MDGDNEVHNNATRTDHELIAAHVAGDPDAFTELVNRHRDRLWAVALRTTAAQAVTLGDETLALPPKAQKRRFS